MKKRFVKAFLLSGAVFFLAGSVLGGSAIEGGASGVTKVANVLPASGAALVLEEGRCFDEVFVQEVIEEDDLLGSISAQTISDGSVSETEVNPEELLTMSELLDSVSGDRSEEVIEFTDISAESMLGVSNAPELGISDERVEMAQRRAAESVIISITMGSEDVRLIKDAEIQAAEEELQRDPEHFANLVIANCDSFVRVRDIPSLDGEVVGKLYDDSVGTFIEEENGWYKITSGHCTGYVSAEYCVTGDAAIELARQVGTRFAVVNTTTLKVRTEPSTEASVMTLVPIEEDLLVLEELEGWVKVVCEDGEGYVCADYVDLHTEFVHAESKEEEEARLAREEEERRRAQQAAQQAVQQHNNNNNNNNNNGNNNTQHTSSQNTYTAPVITGDGLGAQVAQFACQFVGNPYVYGGSSLTNGTDCSGFVMSVYREFGVSLPHSSRSDRTVGSAVEGGLANAQPGDLVCYSGHVALYIGNGQIVHAQSARTGIVISNVNYNNVLAVRRIF